MRRVSYLDEGLVGEEEDQDAPGYLSPFEQQVAEADRAKRLRMPAVDPSIDPAGMQDTGRMPASSGMFSPQDYLSNMDQRQPMPPEYPKEYRGQEQPSEYANFEVTPSSAGYLSDPSLDLIRPDTITGTDTGDPDGEPKPEESKAFAEAPMEPRSNIEGRLSALDAYEKGLAERPALEKPKWWQHALSGVIGGMAGWSNAASRTARPIDATGAQEEIEHPGYKGKLAEWQSRVEPLKAAAEIEQQKVASQQAARTAQQKADVDAAAIRAHDAEAQYKLGMGRSTMVTVTPEVEKATDGRYKTGMKIPSSLAAEIERVQAGKYEKPEHTVRVTDPEIAKHLGFPVNTDVPISVYTAGLNSASRNANEWQLYLNANSGDASKALAQWQKDKVNIARESRPERDTTVRDLKTAQDVDKIDQGKLADERQSEAQYQREINPKNRIITNQEKAVAFGNHIARLQAIQNKYARSIRNRGGSADDYTVEKDGSGGVKYTKVAPASAVEAPPPAQVKAYADKHFGGNLEKAKLKIYADTYFGGDIEKAQAYQRQQGR